MIARDHFPDFAALAAKRDEELSELLDHITKGLASGAPRNRTPKLNTTPPVVREMALKKRILVNLDKLKALAPQVAEVVFALRLDETELAMVMEQRCDSAIEYWRRLADGKVYAGARPLLDMMYRRGISADQLASLTISEIDAVTKHIQTVLERKFSDKDFSRD